MRQGLTESEKDLAEFRPESTSVEEVMSRLDVDAGRGLTTEDAAERLEYFGRNELPRPKRTRQSIRFGRRLLEPMGILLLAAAAVA